MTRTNRTSTRLGKAALVGTLAVGGGYLATTITEAAASPAATPAATPAPAQVAPPGEVSGFVPIPAYRTYDSRIDPDESGKIYLGSDRFVDAALDLDGAEQIPDEATAVTFNVTVTQTEGNGYLQISAAGNSFGETSTVNWRGDGHTIANSGSALLYTGAIFDNNLVFHLGGQGAGAAHVVIDITGYYVPIP